MTKNRPNQKPPSGEVDNVIKTTPAALEAKCHELLVDCLMKTAYMRHAQKMYLQTRGPLALQKAKHTEKAVDQAINQLKAFFPPGDFPEHVELPT